MDIDPNPLPVLMKNDSGVDNQIIKDALESFGEKYVFAHIVRHMERLKGYDRTGIADKDFTDKWDFHDIKLHDFYSEITDEFLQRIGK